MENKRYKKNFLSNVIFKLDYGTLPEYGLEKIKEFGRSVKEEFPIIEEQKIISVEHKFEKTKQIEAKTAEIPKWMLFNKTKTKIISLEPDNLIIESKEYSHFDDFLKIIDLSVKTLFQTFPPVIATRLGLRYINQIKIEEGGPFEWNNLLNKSFLNSLKFVTDLKDMSRYITLIELNKENYRLRFQYGIPNSLYPSPIIKREFILDYDCFTFESLENREEIIDKLSSFHDVILSMFEVSIGESLREIMEVVENV